MFKMFTTRSMLACCLIALTYSAQNHSQIKVDGQQVSLEGRGVVDFNEPGDVEALLTAMYELCDYYSTCNESIQVPEHDRQFLECCVPCDCSDNCYVTGNCCRDKVGGTRAGNKVSEYGEVCTKTHPLDADDVTRSHLLESYCNSKYVGYARMKCENNTGESLEEHTPVLSLFSGFSYSNIHCADCNFENRNSLEPWDISVACTNYHPLVYNGIKEPAIPNGCRVVSRMTSNNGFVHSCYTKSSATECERARYKTLCDTAREGYGFVKDLEIGLCSGCIRQLIDTCVINLSFTFSYEVFLNIDVRKADVQSISDTPTDSSEEATVCPEGKRFNDVEKQCLRLTCAPSQYEVLEKEQRCIDLYTLVRGVCLDYRLRVTIATKHGNSSQLLDHALIEISGAMFTNYPPFQSYIIDYNFSEDYVVYNLRLVDELYSYDFVSDRIREFETILQNGLTLADLQVEQVTDGNSFLTMPLEEIGFLSYNDDSTNVCTKMVAMSGIQICEMIMFAPGEYSTHSDVVVLGNGWEFQPHEYVFRQSQDGRRHVQICLETYLSRKVTRLMGSGGKVVTMNIMSKFVILVWAQMLLQFIVWK